MYAPFNYDQIVISNTLYNPSTEKMRKNKSYDYWVRSLFQRATSVIDFTLPDEWNGPTKDFFIYCLYRYGFVGVFETPTNGVIFNPCSIRGRDVFYNPTHILVSNPAINNGSLERQIGVDCELLKLTPDYRGIFDILDYYAAKLSNIDNAIDMSITNSKLAYVFGAKSKSMANTIKKVMDKINRGESTVVYDELMGNATDKADPWHFLERANLKQSYILSDLLMDQQTLLNSFDAEIGIPSIPYQKKERMVTDEANSRKVDSMARSIVWNETLQSNIKLVNDMFNINISAKLRYEDGDNNGVNL